MTHDYNRSGTTTLFAALNALEGTVIRKCYTCYRHIEFLHFLREIDRQTPAKFDIHLIVDNYSTHKNERVNTWLARHSRFTPTSSSWPNLVERFFREIIDKRIRRGIVRSVRDLTKAIHDFLEHVDNYPKSLAWTKAADQILDKLVPPYAERG